MAQAERGQAPLIAIRRPPSVDMSINVSQIFVRYPDEEDAADVLRGLEHAPSYLVVRTPSPWLAVSSGDNMPAFEAARLLSRALEAEALWYGLAGSILAYRMIRYSLGREVEKTLEPAELFENGAPAALPAYRDVEPEVYAKIRALGVPAEYANLFFEEIGVAGGGPSPADGVLVRDGSLERFRHRVPRRSVDAVRTVFDQVEEEGERVVDQIDLRGAYDEKRGLQLFRTLEAVSRRRTVPPGFTVRFVATSPRDPGLGPHLERLHAAGSYSFEFSAASP